MPPDDRLEDHRGSSGQVEAQEVALDSIGKRVMVLVAVALVEAAILDPVCVESDAEGRFAVQATHAKPPTQGTDRG